MVLAVLLAASLAGYFVLRPAGGPAGPASSAPSSESVVDTSPLEAVRQLAAYAVTPEEQAQAREAWRLADHTVDLAFAAAIRQAEA